MNSQLFDVTGIEQHLQMRKEGVKAEISSYNPDAMATAPEEELFEYFYQKSIIEVPKLKTDDLYMEEEPKETTIYHQQPHHWENRTISVARKGLSFTICVPYEGDRSVLRYQPNPFQHRGGRTSPGEIRDNEIIFHYQAEINAPEEIERLYGADVAMVSQNFQNLSRGIEQFNDALPIIIRQAITERKQQLASKQSIVSAIKIPIKRQTDLPKTYAIPAVVKKPRIEMVPPPKAQKPEPTIPEEEYENILSIVKDLSTTMERSPTTFSKLKEPEIRDIFLVQLNGHYQGLATGETFNGIGKTDILIRYQNETAFIAECKFWKGKKSLSDAITQLLGYVVWRDTKTAIFLFHKGDGLTDVLAQIDDIAKSHPNYKSKHELKNPHLKDSTIFSYKFVHPNDPKKEIILSILTYQINQSSLPTN